MRKVFLDELPRWESGTYKGLINWNESVGQIVRFIYDNIEGKIEIVDYDKEFQRLCIKYKYKDAFTINARNFQKCALGKLLGKKTNEFKIEIGQVFKDNKRDLTIIDREYKKDKNGCNRKYYKYKCNKCGYDEGWIREYDLLNKSGCACCSSTIVVPGINDIPTTDPWMILYFQGGYEEAKLYTKCSGQKIIPICPDCGRAYNKLINISTIYTYKSIGCTCGDGYSYGHKYIFNLLIQLNQYFEDNKKFDWCRFYSPYKDKYVSGEYDFVLKNEKLIIEVDGSFHRKDNNMNGQTAEESHFLDSEKDRLATENGFSIIRISDEGNIKDNILNSKLNELFDLLTIDWLKCEEFALSNRVKEACEIWNNNPNITTDDIATVIKSNRSTIIEYLKKGSKLGWCNYNPKEEISKSSSKNGKMNGKPVEIFKNNESLGVFESTMELERQSEELFGIKLIHSKISATCIGNKPQYKGFTFKYITQ